MFERYTETARRVVHWARYVASQVGCPQIETEHLLLGLLREDMRLARRFFKSPWAVEEVWESVKEAGLCRETSSGSMDIPLATASKHVMAFAAEEADALSSKRIGTSHLLLGVLRAQNCAAAAILYKRGFHLATTREDLKQTAHDDSLKEQFVREREDVPEDVEQTRIRIRSIRDQSHAAIAENDFAKARNFFDEERKERDKLYMLCQQHRLPDWLYE